MFRSVRLLKAEEADATFISFSTLLANCILFEQAGRVRVPSLFRSEK